MTKILAHYFCHYLHFWGIFKNNFSGILILMEKYFQLINYEKSMKLEK